MAGKQNPRKRSTGAQIPTSSEPQDLKRVAIEYRNVDALKAYVNNPRINDHTVPELMESIKKFGFLVPILIDGNSVIVAGHTRHKAAMQLGMNEVPVVVVDGLSEEQINAFRLIDNKVGEKSKWDFDKLVGEIGLLVDSGIELTQLGWSQAEIDCLVDTVDDSFLNDLPADGIAVPYGHNTGTKSGAVTADTATNVQTIRIGDIKLIVTDDEFKRWSHTLRVNCDFKVNMMVAEVANRLGITLASSDDLIRSPVTPIDENEEGEGEGDDE